MKDGIIEVLEWLNVCDDLACENNACIDTKEIWRNNTYEDSVSSKYMLIIQYIYHELL